MIHLIGAFIAGMAAMAFICHWACKPRHSDFKGYEGKE